MDTTTSSDFTEELFFVLLESCTPSRSRVETLTQIALRNLPCATATWSALRRAFVRQQELESDENKALWYVLDSLMKHAPHVFIPLVAPRLFDFVVQQLPWHLAGVVSTYGSGALWCDSMIRTWEGLLPPLLFRTVNSFVVQLRGGKELSRAMNPNDADEEIQTIDFPATREEMQQLQEAWDVFRTFAAEGAVNRAGATPTTPGDVVKTEQTTTAVVATAEVCVKQEPSLTTAGVVKSEYGAHAGVNTDDEDDSDVEYIPVFVRGAQRRELPPLTNENGTAPRPRRAARRRPRDDGE
ncbi:hypothetical protein, conserved [Trypanosoma brucei gambiense DAL972]|uniref:Uncharacterized protein n=2 Tax=Trypanosoma brucei TaxID=5691 RepID=C9ZW91_TRYB9|nr:hypothetical protein, conserved [Trypanosoma brucei gambiense DAL972]RHW72679.1 hypothetical protein DPX39_040056200 [Trypanosoma brucei equiperdum]CBH13680.1 hypothetical protein, conserved [Trypanosoma brucei gambiense DAL972]|eukprot:XP_011775956.1 hypothetical protein, conserved [Trypanosoma brucei gambiense DAL972]